MQNTNAIAPTVMRRKQVVASTGLCAGTISNLILRGEFPASFQLTGLRSVGWLESDVNEWIRNRAARLPIAQAVAAVGGAQT